MLLFDFEDEGKRVSERNIHVLLSNVPVDKLFLREAAKTWLRSVYVRRALVPSSCDKVFFMDIHLHWQNLVGPDNKECPLASLINFKSGGHVSAGSAVMDKFDPRSTVTCFSAFFRG